jgi:hypothetical protein
MYEVPFSIKCDGIKLCYDVIVAVVMSMMCAYGVNDMHNMLWNWIMNAWKFVVGLQNSKFLVVIYMMDPNFNMFLLDRSQPRTGQTESGSSSTDLLLP